MLVGEAIMYNIIANKTSEMVFKTNIKNDLESSCLNYISGRFSSKWLADTYNTTGSYRYRLEKYGEHYKIYYFNTLYPEIGYYLVFDNIPSNTGDRFIIYEDGYYEVEYELDS